MWDKLRNNKKPLFIVIGLLMSIPAYLYRDYPLTMMGYLILHVMDLVGTAVAFLAIVLLFKEKLLLRGIDISFTNLGSSSENNHITLPHNSMPSPVAENTFNNVSNSADISPQQPSVPHRGIHINPHLNEIAIEKQHLSGNSNTSLEQDLVLDDSFAEGPYRPGKDK